RNPTIRRNKKLPTTTVVAMGNWAGNKGNPGMQRAAGSFARKDIERRVRVSMHRHYENVYFAELDENRTSRQVHKLRALERGRRADKTKPAKGTKAFVKRTNGTEGTFEVAQHKKWGLYEITFQEKKNGPERTIVTNRDEPTNLPYAKVVVHDLE